MADQGAIGRPNGGPQTAYFASKFSSLWQNDGTAVPVLLGDPNGVECAKYTSVRYPLLWQNIPVDSYTVRPNGVEVGDANAVKFPLLWQNDGIYPVRGMPNAIEGGDVYAVPWYNWYIPTLVLQGVLNCNGSIYGTVTSGGLPVVNARVQLETGWGLLLENTFTNAAGFYRFDGLILTYTDYSIIVPDPTNTFNLGRLDNMTPV